MALYMQVLEWVIIDWHYQSFHIIHAYLRQSGLMWLLFVVCYLILLGLARLKCVHGCIMRSYHQSHNILELISRFFEVSKSTNIEPYKYHIRSPPPPISLTIEPKMVNKFWTHTSQCKHLPLECRRPMKISNWFRHAHLTFQPYPILYHPCNQSYSILFTR